MIFSNDELHIILKRRNLETLDPSKKTAFFGHKPVRFDFVVVILRVRPRPVRSKVDIFRFGRPHVVDTRPVCLFDYSSRFYTEF